MCNVIDFYLQVDVGTLAACFTAVQEGTSYCMVQLFQPMDSAGTPLHNEFDCPLLQLTNVFYCVPSDCINMSVSVIHECTNSCVFQHQDRLRRYERELIADKNAVFFLLYAFLFLPALVIFLPAVISFMLSSIIIFNDYIIIISTDCLLPDPPAAQRAPVVSVTTQ